MNVKTKTSINEIYTSHFEIFSFLIFLNKLCKVHNSKSFRYKSRLK